jgi:hypothetical protein
MAKRLLLMMSVAPGEDGVQSDVELMGNQSLLLKQLAS